MMVCTQCNGKGYLASGEPLNVAGQGTFTAPTQVPETPCPSCVATGKMNSFGTS
jgi:hypothetical protein